MEQHVQWLERSTEAAVRAQHHWQARRELEKRSPSTGVTIALSREAGVLGTSVAQELGRLLGWPVYDHELVQMIAEEMGLRVTLLESVDERHRGWLNEAMEQFMSVPNVSESTYVRHLVETILSLGTHGECVVVEHGAAQILPVA